MTDLKAELNSLKQRQDNFEKMVQKLNYRLKKYPF